MAWPARLAAFCWLLSLGFLLVLLLRARREEVPPVVRRRHSDIVLHAVKAFLVLAWVAIDWDRRLAFGPWSGALRWLGVAFLITGLGLWCWAAFTLGRWWSVLFAVREGHPVIQDGPYRLVRHPIYLGLSVALPGTALALASLRTLIVAVLLMAIFYIHALEEERVFLAELGDEYRDYMRRVPRLFPSGRTGW